MRIYAYVFGGLLVTLVLGAVGYMFKEKIVLAVAGYQLRADMAALKRMAYKPDATPCPDGLRGYQLRFESETDYVIEPLCASEASLALQRGRLAGGVLKSYGSGVLIELETGTPLLKDTWVHLIHGSSQLAVGLFDGMPALRWDVADLSIGGESPAIARCAEWGFECCNLDVEVGELSRVRTYDCVNSCYQRCNRLPAVLYFNTYPVLDAGLRQVLIPKADPFVRFGFEIADEEMVSAEIDLGDGRIIQGLGARESEIEHEYQCQSVSCVYMVVLRATDASGYTLVSSPLNQIRVVVR